jgi:hypothetical protein
MPAPVSKKQYRYMMAILHEDHGRKKDAKKTKGKAKSHEEHGSSVTSSRGDTVPVSVAAKYRGGSPDGLPESKGKEHEGGHWDSHHQKKARARTEEKRTERKKEKAEKRAKLHKAFEDFYDGQGVGVVVVNDRGQILLGQDSDGKWSTPGGHVEAGESFEDAVRRELKEESGLSPKLMHEIGGGVWEGNDSKVYVVDAFDGKLGTKTDGELKSLGFTAPENIPWANMRHCSLQGLSLYFNRKLNKSLSEMIAAEELAKNIIRSSAGSDVVYEMRHDQALKLVGNGTFRLLRSITEDMEDEDFREFKFDHYTISVRRHTSDVYSGRVTDGHKLVHQWTNRSLPAMAAELMSVFEWYSPKDEKMIEKLIDEDIDDDAIHGGLQALTDNYRKHNISSIYAEMENIRSEVRNGVAVDVQQIEQRIMKLFDKLETTMHSISDKHNQLCNDSGEEIDQIHAKLLDLQAKLDGLANKPAKVEAFSSNPANPAKVHDEGYPYLPRPQVTVHPDGRITIGFGEEWTPMERQNFLQDMRAKVLDKKSSKTKE